MRTLCPDVRVTGSGVVTCLGASREATLAALARDERVCGEPVPFLADSPYAACLAVSESVPDVSGCITERRMRKFMSRPAELAAVAARQALAQAMPFLRGIAPERMGLYAGVGLAAVDIRASVEFLRKSLDTKGQFSQAAFAKGGLYAIHPLWSFHTLANMPACIISVLENIKGDNGIYTPWEDQAAFALVEAAFALERGDIDCAVVVASDAPGHPASLVELARAGHLAQGDVAACGAACLVLERADEPSAPPHAFTLRNMRLALTGGTPKDPLAPFIGRTVAAAPLLLAALAPYSAVHRSLAGCGGHVFSFEVA